MSANQKVRGIASRVVMEEYLPACVPGTLSLARYLNRSELHSARGPVASLASKAEGGLCPDDGRRARSAVLV